MAYHIAEILVLLPWCVLLFGALRKVWAKSDRLQRLQLEGAAIIVLGMLGAILLFDAAFGLDAERKSKFAVWYPWGERGLFWIGVLLVGLGLFLERRPRPGLKPWPSAGKAAAFVGILAGTITALAVHGRPLFLGTLFPWSPVRIVLSMGVAPFAMLYLLDALKNGPQSNEEETIC